MTTQDKKYLTYGAVGVGLVAAYFIFFNNSEPGTGNGVDPTGNGSISPNGGNNGNGGVATTFNAHKVAVELYDLMKPTGFASFVSLNGDEADLIIDTLTKVNQSQFGEVVKAFGKLPYNSTFGNQSFMLWSDPTNYDLVFWLKTELGVASETYKTLKAKYPNYL